MKPFRALASHAILLGLLGLAVAPFVMMFNLSLRDSLAIAVDFWSWPDALRWGNYLRAAQELARPILNTFLVAGGAIAGVLFLSVLSGYAFARLEFPGKKILFGLVISLLMVPGILLLTPKYVLATDLGLRDSYWGLWCFYLSSGQVMGIFLVRSFFESLPEELFESARLDGAREWECLWYVALPLSRTVLVTVGILTFLALYNDLIWPMLVLSDPQRETLMVALLRFAPVSEMTGGRPDVGAQTAGYALASLPVLVIFWLGMKSYVRGVLAGAVK